MKSRNKTATAETQVVAEIGNSWFKLAEVTARRDSVLISRLHLARVAGGRDVPPEALAEAARKLGLTGRPVMAFLPREVVTVRLLDLPSTDPHELADMIDLQVDKQTPYSSAEILSEFRILNSDGEGYSRVMLVIVQRSILRRRFHVLEEAGFDVTGMSISSEGLAAWHERLSGEPPRDSGCHAVLDIDYSYSDFTFVRAGRLCHTAGIRIGARHLQADHAKGVDALCRDVDRSLAAFRTESAGLAIDKILLTGATKHARGLASRLSEAHDCVVEPVPPTRGMEMGHHVPDPTAREYALFSLTPLAGIVVRPKNSDINLVPEPVKMRKRLQTKAGNLHVLGVRVMAAVLLICMVLVAKLSRRKALLAEVIRQRIATEAEARDLEQMKLKTKIVTQRMDARTTTVAILRELHRLVLDTTLHLTRFELEGARAITLRGSANALSDVITFAGSIEKSTLFQNVKNTRTSQKRGTTDFEITCTLEYP